MFDYIIRGGTVVDGSGQDGYPADVGIRDGKIAAIGDLCGETTAVPENTLDGTGLIVSPGFINMHSHGDQTLFLFPKGEGTVRQGITTCFCGNCGATPGPIDKMWVRKFWEYDAWDEVDPYIDETETILPREQVVPIVEAYFGTKIDWSSISEYMEKMEREGISFNYIPNVGHGDIRAQVMGNENRKPTEAEMEEMKRYLREALEAGVYGMTTGRDYAPGNYADIDELTELVKIVEEYGGIYTTHWRNRGRDAEDRTKGLLEAFELARRTGVKLHVNHLSDLFYTMECLPCESASIRAGKTLRYIDDARKEGLSFIFDVIPNESGGFEYIPHLSGYFMPWIRISGSIENFIANLSKRNFLSWLRHWIEEGKGGLINPAAFPQWDRWLQIVSSEKKEYVGKSIAELYDRCLDRDSIDTVLRILKEEPLIRTKTVRFEREIVAEFLNHDLALVGTDSFSFDGYGTFGRKKSVPDILVHPNTLSGMVSYITKFGYRRIEDTIRKITGKAADWLGLSDRGYIREGFWADITVLRAEELCTNENYEDPCQYPSGIEYVFVNGELVVGKNGHTGAKPGKVLRRK